MDVGLLFMEMNTLMRFIAILYAPLYRRSFDLAKILSRITRDISMITRLRLVVVFVGEEMARDFCSLSSYFSCMHPSVSDCAIISE